jgi:triacylglycerol esterase/lipase EstA (alpha/beta hydrolase family)
MKRSTSLNTGISRKHDRGLTTLSAKYTMRIDSTQHWGIFPRVSSRNNSSQQEVLNRLSHFRVQAKHLSLSFRIAIVVFVLVYALALGGCATPVGVRQLDPKQVQRNLTANILSSDELSSSTKQILNRANLADRFRSDPPGVLAELHKGLPTATEADRLYALAEMSYAYASEKGPKEYFFASAIYAYAFLFPKVGRTDPDRSDPRIRIAMDLYNRSIAEALTTPDRSHVLIKGGTYKIPFGELTVTVNPDEFSWGSFELVDFVQAAELDVRGLRNRYRWPGIGAPLAASMKPIEGVSIPAYAKVAPRIKVPVTAFLRLEDVDEGMKTGTLTANLEIYTPGEATTVNIDGRTVPIEYELSSALAYTLEGSQDYSFELKGLFSGDFSLFKDKARYQDGIFLMGPHQPGRNPVIFVHGTASSPARWAEMFNELINDPALWGQYEYWVFTYNTGNPVVYSAGILADGLRKTVQELDPDGKDPALRKMIVIGHSQGGLLTKLTVIDTGTKLWDAVSNEPLEDLQASPETKEILRRSLFFTPVPSVKRVIFLSTPHWGSFLAGNWIGHLTSKFISLPSRLDDTMKKVAQIHAWRSMKEIPRSTDNMDPRSSFVQIYNSFPIAPGVTAHSIIAVKNPNDPKEKWNDGVVEYKSAHIEPVKSELVVNSGHSSQHHPETIEEVRRILLEHLRESAD